MQQDHYDRQALDSRISKLRHGLDSLSNQLREDVSKTSDPRAEALFETTAEVLRGLLKAFEHFAEGSEAAWRPGPGQQRPDHPRR